MLELGLRRALVISTLTLAATFAAGAAQAQQPPPAAPLAAPSAPAPQAPATLPPEAKAPPVASPRAGFDLGYTGAPPGYSAPADAALPFERQPEYPQEMHARSSKMVAGGVVLLSFGMVGLFAGSAMVAAHEPLPDPNSCFGCGFEEDGGRGGSGSSTPTVVIKPGFKTAGIVTLVGSVAAIAASIPIIVIGAKKVPYADDASPAAKAARLTPSVHVGPASATLTWQF